jgi:peroxiredoxin
MPSLFPLLLPLFSILAPPAGESFPFEPVQTGTIAKFNYYRVLQKPMTTAKPESIKKEPKYKNAPLYTTLTFGTDTKKPVVFALDEDDTTATFYIDSNANGDLTDDAPPVLWRKQEAPPERRKDLKVWVSYWFDGTGVASYGNRQEPLGIKFYIYSKADRERSKIEPTLLYYRDYYRLGSVTLGGKAFRAALIDDNSDGRYDSPADPALRFSGDTLLIDRDGSGTFERGRESYSLASPFNVGGVTYETRSISASGDSLSVRKSEKTVAEKADPPSLKVSAAPPAFSLPDTTGKTISPENYRGKVVLLDFWATWCGPCVAEMPAVRKLYEAYHDKGFEIVGISLDDPKDGAKIEKFVQENKIAWPQIHDTTHELSKKFFVTAIPATFLIGKDGKITAVDLRGDELEKAVAAATSLP